MFRHGKIRLISAGAFAALLCVIAIGVMGLSPAPVTVKLTPAMVLVDTSELSPKMATAEMDAAWRLFDRDTGTAYAPMQTARITVSLRETRSVSRVRVYGSPSYQMNVYRDNSGNWERVPSLFEKDLSTLGASWNSLVAEPFNTAHLLLEFVPVGNVTTGLAEVELWGPDSSEQENISQVTLGGIRTPQEALAILDRNPSHILELGAAPSELSVEEGSTPAVTLGITQNPSLFKRAYILYDGYNLVRPVSIQRRINGLSWAGGFVISQSENPEPSWSSYIEEINPAWLAQGENRIEFQTSGGSAAIRGLRLIIETDSGWNSVSALSSPASYDGDTATSYKIAASSSDQSLDITFERTVQPHTLKLHLSGPMNVKAGLQYQSGTVWQEVKSAWQIDFSTMQAGWNEIKLPAAVSADALKLVFKTAGLRIKPGVLLGMINEVRVSASPAGPLSSSPRIIISYPRDGEYFGRTAFIQGFATPISNSGATVQEDIEGKTTANADGSFSLSLTKDETRFSIQSDDESWDPAIRSEYGGQPGASFSLMLNKNSGNLKDSEPKNEDRGNAPFGDNREKFTDRVTPGQAKKIQYKGVTLDIPAGAVDKDTNITIVPLNEADLAHYNPGMINVTFPDAGYRFLPHGMKFKKPINISFGYAKQLFAAGQTDNDVNMYYYDESLLRWQQLTRVKADSSTSQVTSSSDHFTDIINSTLVVPEHPQALSFNPNSIKDIKAADPSANVNLIEPPKANNKGTANLSYPIEVPPGRNNLQPNVAVQYNSSGGNGWMGLGWDIPMQAITIDTRWGVPRYDSTYDDTPNSNMETETYILDGEQLTPMAHRGALQPRTSEKVFHTRVEGQFRKIIRHGSQPNNYWWEVIDKNGTKYFYGGKPDSKGIPNSEAVLAKPVAGETVPEKPVAGDIFKWALRQIRDMNGNTVNFTYTIVPNTGIIGGTVIGYQIYLKKIDYTGRNDDPGAYSVVFSRDREMDNFVQRPDVTIDARSGFKMVTADLLKRIEVHFKDSKKQDFLVRSYTFDYAEEAFRKMLLQAVSQYGANNTFFNKHQFSYYDNVRDSSGQYIGFKSETTWDTKEDNIGKNFLGLQFDASALSGSEGTNIGGMLYVGFSLLPTKYISIGGKGGMSSGNTEALIAMVDINGDGLPDKVFRCGEGLCYRLNTSGPHSDTSNIRFDDAQAIMGISHISKDSSDQTSGGVQGFYIGASALVDDSSTMTTQSVYFSDVNGDGLVDLVDNGIVYFNHLDASRRPVFTPNSNDTPVPIGQSSVNANGMIPDFSQRYEQLIDQNPLLDSVRRWVAPFDGVLTITGGIQLVDTTQDRIDKNYTTADGVRVAIQKEGGELWSDTINGTDFSVHNPVNVSSIPVNRGDRIYFRVQSVFDGSYDQVQWNPVITYSGAPVDQLDVNSLPAYKFTAGDDLVYSGRVFPITMPFRGKLRIDGDLIKKGITTDDVTLAIYLNDVQISRSTLAWDQTGNITPSADDIDVQKDDVLVMKVLVDSDIDQKQIEWKPQVFYVEAYYPDVTALDKDGNPAKDEEGNPAGPVPGSPVTVKDDKGNYIIQLKPLYDVEFYPGNNLLAPQQSWTATRTGTILVTPYVTPIPNELNPGFNFNSEVVFTVKRRTALLGKNVIQIVAGSAYDPRHHSFEVSVNAGDELFFDFSSRDHELAGKIQGVSASAHYIAPDRTAPINNVRISLDGTANPPRQSWTSPQTGTATITPVLATQDGSPFSFDSTLTLNVLVEHTDNSGQGGPVVINTLYTRGITIVKGENVSSASYAFDIPVESGDKLNFYYTTSDASLPGKPITSSALVRIAAAISVLDVPNALHTHTIPNVFSKPYRGWGYITYNGNRARANEPIHQELFVVSGNQDDYSRTDPNEASSSPRDFYITMPDASQERWTSADQHWWISSDVMSSSRLGLQYISVPKAEQFNGAVGVPRITKSSQTSVGAGYYIAISAAQSPTETILDFMDMNGDAFPDIVGNGKVQYTSMVGTLESGSKDLGFGSVRDSETDSLTLSPGGTVPDSIDLSKYTPPPKEELQNPSFGLSGSLGGGKSYTNCDMMDVNGDGLPDRVCESGGTLSVQLNLGYGFAGSEVWGSAKLNKGSSINGSLSISYSDGVKGFAGGPSVSSAMTRNEAALIDINGDGLLDRVYNDGNSIWVGFNKGAGFADPVQWHGNLGHRINSGLSGNFFAGVSYYYPIGPLCPLTPFCYIIINPEVNGGMSMSREESMLRDVKGDGTADHLYSSHDGSLHVAVNRTQNTNLLKTVKRPLGGKFEIEYQREGNTYEMPQSQWTMTKTTLTDGIRNAYVTAFSYAKGYKDRYEREFYGFRTVTETHAPGTSIARQIIQNYYNSDYYRKGLVQTTLTRDKKANPGFVWSKSENDYQPQAVKDVNGNVIADTVFPALVQTTTSFYDGSKTNGDNRNKYTYQTFEYDEYGNVKTFNDLGEVFSAGDDVTATITYYTDLTNYIIKPETILVKHGSTQLRKRVATYYQTTGNLERLTLHNTKGPESVWTMTYYENGNLWTITDPVGYKLTYWYDSEVATHVVRIEDNFTSGAGGPYYSTAGYKSLLFGQPDWTQDLNGNYQVNLYDEFGRIVSICGPHDAIAGNPPTCAGNEAGAVAGPATSKPTIAFEYRMPSIGDDGEINGIPSLKPARAITHNKAVSSKESDAIIIKTITFADGMKRIIQTKKDADVYVGTDIPDTGMTVSGKVVFDELGRVEKQGQPEFDTASSLEFIDYSNPLNATLFSYDTLDRTIEVLTPDPEGILIGLNRYAKTTTIYSFEEFDGHVYAKTAVVDPEGNNPNGKHRGTKISYKDVDDRIVGVIEYNFVKDSVTNGTIPVQVATRYEYDPLGQIVTVVDTRGNTSSIEYDDIGNRLAINNPDTGKTVYNYDANGNVISKFTANNHKISYRYDFNRLMGIDYPNSLKTASVAYQYGRMGEMHNRAGRIMRVTDESGEEIRYYGKLGETLREEKTMLAHTPAVQRKKFSTDYVFDSFGRMVEMTYPDGEKLHYGYDHGGLLKAAWGEKSGNRYNYITSLQYDKFGQRNRIVYGNGTRSTYEYNELTRRLSKLTTVLNNGRTIQDIAYHYDLVGNVKEALNDIYVPTSTALPAGDVRQKYSYDDLYQIVNAEGWYSFGPGKENNYRNEFFYDTIGNFTKKKLEHEIVQPSTTKTFPKETNYVLNYVYGSSHPHAVTDAGDKLYSYDANGNMTGWIHKQNGTRRVITWSEENRVKQIDDNGKATYFLYDDAGERVVKRGQHGETIYVNRFYSIRNGELGTKSVYAGETRVVSKLVKTPPTNTANSSTTNTGSNVTSGTTTTIPGINGLDNGRGKKLGIIRRLPDGYQAGVNPPVEKDQFYYHGDHLGSSNMITDAYGAVYQHLEYFPYGETWIEEGGSYGGDTPGYKFTGKELDPETGLYYYGARYYDPVLSKWISTDPALEKFLPTGNKDRDQNLPGMGGVFNPVNLSAYAYGHNDPVRTIDPDGRDALIVAFTQYKVGTPSGHMPFLGHAGVVIIDNKTGATRYYEYGRYDQPQQGVVKRRSVPNVQIGSNGKPTEASMKNLMKSLASGPGKGSNVEGAYIKNDNFQQMVNYAEKRRGENADPGRKPYGNLTNNCMTFCGDVAKSGNALTPPSLIDWPNQDIGDLQKMYPSLHYNPNQNDLSGMLYDKPQGIGEHIESWVNKAWEKVTGD